MVWLVSGLVRHQSVGPRRREDRPVRTVGFRQIDFGPLHQSSGKLPEGPYPDRWRPSRRQPEDHRPGAARRRHGVPAIQPVPASHRDAELHAGADPGASASRASPKRRPGGCLPGCKFSIKPTNIRPSFPAASSNALPSRAHSAWEPKLMLFDEPTSALDPEVVERGPRYHDRVGAGTE